MIKILASRGKSGEPIEISYSNCKIIGNGSFGVVFEAKLVSGLDAAKPRPDANPGIAIKKVLQDKRFKNRELQIMRIIDHPNVCDLRAFFYSNGNKVCVCVCVFLLLITM